MLPRIVVCADDPVIELDILETIRRARPDTEIEVCGSDGALYSALDQSVERTIVITESENVGEDLLGRLRAADHLRHIHFGDGEDLPDAVFVPLPFRSEDVVRALRAVGFDPDAQGA